MDIEMAGGYNKLTKSNHFMDDTPPSRHNSMMSKSKTKTKHMISPPAPYLKHNALRRRMDEMDMKVKAFIS